MSALDLPPGYRPVAPGTLCVCADSITRVGFAEGNGKYCHRHGAEPAVAPIAPTADWWAQRWLDKATTDEIQAMKRLMAAVDASFADRIRQMVERAPQQGHAADLLRKMLLTFTDDMLVTVHAGTIRDALK